MAEMPPSTGHEQWSEPATNWLDHFIQAKQLRELVEKREKTATDQETLRSLFIQFAEQASACEKETDALVLKQFPSEDIAFNERKSACLWLCCFTCFSAIDFDFERTREKFEDVLILQTVFIRLESWTRERNGWQFAEWLVSRWILYNEKESQVPHPPAKQTVSNPGNQLDAVLAKFDAAKRCIAEVRIRSGEAIVTLEKMISEGKDMEVPLPDCFLQPFLEEGGLSLSIGIAGHNVLVEGVPKPSINGSLAVIKSFQLVEKCRFDLISSHMMNGEYARAMVQLRKLRESVQQQQQSTTVSPLHALVSLDRGALNGYCAAFRLPPLCPEAAPSTSKEDGDMSRLDEKLLTAFPRPPQRHFATRRYRSLAGCPSTATPQFQMTFFAENTVEDLVDGISLPSLRATLQQQSGQMSAAFAKAMARCLATSRTTSLLLKAVIKDLSATVPGMAAALRSAGVGDAYLGDRAALPLYPPLMPPPTPQGIKNAITSEQPFWTMLTSFDVTEIKPAIAALTGGEQKYTRPKTFKFPDLLADLLLNPRQINEYYAALLAKLQQQCDIGDQEAWSRILDQYAKEMGASLRADLMQMIIYEGCRVQCIAQNMRALTPHAHLESAKAVQVLKVIKNMKNTTQHPPLIIPMLSFMLNMSEWDFIMKKLDIGGNPPPLTVNVARLLAAYVHEGCASSTTTAKAIIATWNSVVSTFFESTTTKRRLDGAAVRDLSKGRQDLIHLFRLIKNGPVQSFLISYFCHIYSQALVARERSHLRVYVELANIFSNDIKVSHANLDALHEVLTALFATAEVTNPQNVAWLRARADFHYVQHELDEAGVLYLEALVAMKPSLAPPLTHTAIDESVWNHLRLCLRKQNQQTLAACVCQLFQSGNSKEYRDAARTMETRCCLDASDDCFDLIFERELLEWLTEAYSKKGQQHKVDALLSTISRPCMNASNSAEVSSRERSLRFCRLLRTLAAHFFTIHY